MAPKAKQKRSQDRINKILNTAEEILDTESMDSLTIARISHIAELKRTSTYKFFQTPDEIKLALVERYMENCNHLLASQLDANHDSDYPSCLKECVVIIMNFFKSNPGAQKLILENTMAPSIPSSDLHKIASTILDHVESSIGLPNMFNKPGVFLVVSQIIFSILSLNTKEDGELTDVGLNEAVRATHAYLLSCIAVPT
tara:strand:- start:355 stop:951 length:597 start_codon:yes stop_codon:yes gene_type:complete